MKKNIQKACSCMKETKPHVLLQAPMGTITTSSLMKLISIAFLHLDVCSDGHKYILVITDHLSKFTQAYPTTNKYLKSTSFITILYWGLEGQTNPYTIKEGNSRTVCFTIWQHFAGRNKYVLRYTTLSPRAKWKDLKRPLFLCCPPLLITWNPSVKTKLTSWSIHTVVPSNPRLVLHLVSCSYTYTATTCWYST